jgi:hypothetical protein
VLEWKSTWGPKIEILKKFQESSGITPAALANRPKLEEHLHFVWDLFHELAESRDYSDMGSAKALDLTKFLSHACLWQFTRCEAQETWQLVRVLDREWLRLQSERQAKAAAKPAKKAS